MAVHLTIRKGIQVKKISQYAWDLLPEGKNGWELAEATGQVVVNEVPSSGKVVDAGTVVNEAENKDQIVVNEISETNEDLEAAGQVVLSEKEKFISFATEAKIKTGLIKDFLDINDVKYKQKDSPEVLIEKLADFFGNDIEKLKTEFSL